MEPKEVALTIGPNTTYKARDLVSERLYKGRYEECLVRWVLQGAPEKLNKDEELAYERASKEYCVWMRRGEMEACCPHLAAIQTTSDTVSSAGGVGDETEMDMPPSMGEKDEALAEMKADVQHLIGRAKRMMDMTQSVATGKILADVVGILNAYAKIGILTDAFQEYGAVDLLLGLLGSQDLDVRKRSSEMLRSLTSFDLSIRSYILLQILKSDEGSESSLQSRQMLLDLFSETASSDESDVRGVAFPQVRLYSVLEIEARGKEGSVV
jgi:hypothetical protein